MEEFTLKPCEQELLDVFACQAMNGIITTTGWEVHREPDEEDLLVYQNMAVDAYDMATAMIVERRKRLQKTWKPN